MSPTPSVEELLHAAVTALGGTERAGQVAMARAVQDAVDAEHEVCAANKDDQRWKIENGQIKNVTQAGVPRGRCIQGGIDGVQAIMGNCSTTDEQWISEVHGSKARADAVGRLRTPSSNLCLEPNAAQVESGKLPQIGRAHV